jgi:hypothetical protein
MHAAILLSAVHLAGSRYDAKAKLDEVSSLSGMCLKVSRVDHTH